jgi:hypothetical protein
VRGSLRRIERPEVPELAVWLAAGLIAMAARMTAINKRRIRRDYRRDRGIALQIRLRSVWTCPISFAERLAQNDSQQPRAAGPLLFRLPCVRQNTTAEKRVVVGQHPAAGLGTE